MTGTEVIIPPGGAVGVMVYGMIVVFGNVDMIYPVK
jgi:hypothetical protein